MAMVANAAFTRKGNPWTPAEFDPFAPKPEPIKVSIGFIFEAMTEKKRNQLIKGVKP